MECGLEEEKGCCSLRGTTAGEDGVGRSRRSTKMVPNDAEGRAWIGGGEGYSKF
jgi:hypothetical protein